METIELLQSLERSVWLDEAYSGTSVKHKKGIHAARRGYRNYPLCPHAAPVERANLTVRRSVAGLARRTWATAQEAPQLVVHLEWWRGYYHFVRPHTSLRVTLALPIKQGGRRQSRRYRQRTPAMAAGLAQRRWTVQDLLTLPLPPEAIDTV